MKSLVLTQEMIANVDWCGYHKDRLLGMMGNKSEIKITKTNLDKYYKLIYVQVNGHNHTYGQYLHEVLLLINVELAHTFQWKLYYHKKYFVIWSDSTKSEIWQSFLNCRKAMGI